MAQNTFSKNDSSSFIYKLIFSFILIFNILNAEESKTDAYLTATLSMEPSSIVGGCINAITGDFVFTSTDLIAEGVEPFPLNHIYTSRYRNDRFPSGAFNFPHLKISGFLNTRFTVTEPSGIKLQYCTPPAKMNGKKEMKKHFLSDKTLLLHPDSLKGLTNSADLESSGRVNIKNNKIYLNYDKETINVHCPDGSIRYYKGVKYSLVSMLKLRYDGVHHELLKRFQDSFAGIGLDGFSMDSFYLLREERLANGNRIVYVYDNQDHLTGAKLMNPSKTRVFSSLSFNNGSFACSTSCGKSLTFTADVQKRKHKIVDGYNKDKKRWKRREVESINSFIFFSKKTTENPDVIFTYLSSEGKVISDYILPDKRHIHIDYYTIGNHQINNMNINIPNKDDPRFMRAKTMYVFNETTNQFSALYYFVYHPGKVGETAGSTEVYDKDFNKTIYTYSSNLNLESLERYYLKNGQYNLKNCEKLVWGKENTSDFTFLLCRSFLDSQRRAVFSKRYFYDVNGNIVKETFYGSLTGLSNIPLELENGFPKNNGVETFSKYRTFSNDGRNLLIRQEDDSGIIESFTYLNDTDKIKSKIISYKNISNIKKRFFYEYDFDNILTVEITDDGLTNDQNNLYGVTKRQIKKIFPVRSDQNYGMTDFVEEFYLDLNTNKEILIKIEKYYYNENRRIIKKDIFGSDNALKYSLTYGYDAKGNLASQTNPINQMATYAYDANNNKINETSFSGKKIAYRYDNLNRLIEKTVFDQNTTYQEKYTYDLKNNKTSASDIYGNVTEYKYDDFDNLIMEIQPQVPDSFGKMKSPVKLFKYDDLNRQIEKTDALSNVVRTTFNALNKPLVIEYADGTREQNFYNPDGTLKENINQEGTITEYEYDYQKRPLSKIITSSDGKDTRKETYEYDAFNIIAKIDAEGNNTKYTYDGALRKIREEVFSKDNQLLSSEEFFYDVLGFLKKQIDGKALVTTFQRDNLGRETIVAKENLSGKELFKIKYEYDEAGNKKNITSYIANKESSEKRYYDVFNRLTKSVDALEKETNISYPFEANQKYKIEINENAIHQKIIKTYDPLEREISSEVINPQGLRVSFEEKFYDLNGNLSLQKSYIYDLTTFKLIKTVENYFEYDQMNRLIVLKEAYKSKDEKTTSYSYTKTGNVKVTTKPDSTRLINEYDAFGNKTRLYSSKKDIDYLFIYNNLNQITESIDNISNEKILRKYDPFNNLTEENQINGFKIQNDFDLLGNRIKCCIKANQQNNIYVEYSYDPLNIKEILRKDNDGNILYNHTFEDYDLSGNLLKERMILGSAESDYQLDCLGRIREIKNNYHIQNAEYDSIGRITNIRWRGFSDDLATFQYDDLNQIISETGKFSNSYSFDSHNNRLKKNSESYNINDLNEIISISNLNVEFEYDKNGNPILKKKPDGKAARYHYDSLDRLIKIEDDNYILEFRYDSFNRRIYKNVTKCSFCGIQEEDFRYFLYDDQNEIGSFDKNFNKKELRILSDTDTAEIGSAIAFEIGNDIYAPVYDISGNVTSLISEGSLKEHYRYSVFGEKKVYSNDPTSPKSTINRLIYTNPNEYLISQIHNPWQFSSKRIDEESNLVYFGRRYYDPQLGRWLTCDPLGFADGLNLYAFVLNDPLIKYDLYGLYSMPPWMRDSLGGVLHSGAGFGAGSVNFMSDIGFGLSSPFLYGYRSITGGSFKNDYQMHLQSKANLRIDTQNFMQKIFPVNQNSKAYNFTHDTTNSFIDGALLGSGIGGIYKGAGAFASQTLNALERASQATKGFISKTGSNFSKVDMLSENRVYGGIDVERIIKDMKQYLNKNKQNDLSLLKNKKIIEHIGKYVGKDAKLLHNQSGDIIIESKDGLKQFRIDLNHTEPHKNPHSHLIQYYKFKNKKLISSDKRIYPSDVSPE